MLKMDLVHVIRHKYYQEGLSQRQIARDTGCARNTVARYVEQAEPEYRKTKPRSAPIREKTERMMRSILAEWEDRTTDKQRITGARLHEELVSRGLEVGLTTVREVFKEIRREQAEVFIPLVYRPGEEAQVDFFEVTVDDAGTRRKVWMFLMRLMYSKRDFAWLYESCNQLAFLDGHVRAFAHLGGVPHRIVYDNLSAAVKKIVLGRRELTDQMLALRNHYQFEDCFARVGRGDDKGGVESRGKGVRWQSLTPIPRGHGLQDLSEKLMAKLEKRFREGKSEQDEPLAELFKVEQKYMRALVGEPFRAQEVRFVSVSKSSTVKLKGARYSLPSHWARLQITAYIGLETVEFCHRGLRLVRPRGSKGGSVIQYTDYLRELSRKPQAVRQVGKELMQELGEPYGELWTLLMASHGPKEGSRVMAKILAAIVERGHSRVTDALFRALRAKSLNLPEFGLTTLQAPKTVAVPNALVGYEIISGRASDYDYLLAVGA